MLYSLAFLSQAKFNQHNQKQLGIIFILLILAKVWMLTDTAAAAVITSASIQICNYCILMVAWLSGNALVTVKSKLLYIEPG